MPPKTAPKTVKFRTSDKEALELVDAYFAKKPDLEKLIKDAREGSGRSFTEKRQTDYDRKVKEAVREVLEERRKRVEDKNQSMGMPSHPKDNDASSGAKDNKSPNPKATVEDHKANPGPVINQNLGEPASKEELKKRAEELNKK